MRRAGAVFHNVHGPGGQVNDMRLRAR